MSTFGSDPTQNHPSRARNLRSRPNLSISCDSCSMARTAACDDCVVSFVLRAEEEADQPVVFDLAEERAVRLLSKAGLIPGLRFEAS